MTLSPYTHQSQVLAAAILYPPDMLTSVMVVVSRRYTLSLVHTNVLFVEDGSSVLNINLATVPDMAVALMLLSVGNTLSLPSYGITPAHSTMSPTLGSPSGIHLPKSIRCIFSQPIDYPCEFSQEHLCFIEIADVGNCGVHL